MTVHVDNRQFIVRRIITKDSYFTCLFTYVIDTDTLHATDHRELREFCPQGYCLSVVIPATSSVLPALEAGCPDWSKCAGKVPHSN